MTATAQQIAPSVGSSEADDPRYFFEFAVPPAALEDLYPATEGLWRQMERKSAGRFTVRGMLERVAAGTWQLHLIMDREASEAGDLVAGIVCTAHMLQDDGRPVCRLCMVTGRHMRDWIELVPELSQWARDTYGGNTICRMLAREGWRAQLKPFGFRPRQVELELTPDAVGRA